MRAEQILDLLRARHAADTFVAECKTGPGGVLRLDAWAALRTWSPWTTIGYEIKVNRGDWLRDTKWHEYRDVCHEMWIASSPTAVNPEEVPEGVGLLVASKNGGRLVTKRKALRRDPDPKKIIRLMGYVLMSRANIVANMYEVLPAEQIERRTAADCARLRRIVEAAADRRQLAAFVNEHVARTMADALSEAGRERRAAEIARGQLWSLVSRLSELGVAYDTERGLEAARTAAMGAALALGTVDRGIVRGLAGARRRIVEELDTVLELLGSGKEV